MRPSIFLLCVVLGLSQAWAQNQPIVTTDLLRIRSVSAIDVAEDGSRAVLTVKSIETIDPPAEGPVDPEHPPQPTWANRSHLFLLELTRPGMPRQLTQGFRSDSSPAFSADGRRIVFLRAGESGKSKDTQAWIIPSDGGEARQVTDFEHGVSAVTWSPDGTRLLVTAPVPMADLEGAPPWPLERPKRAWKDAELSPEETARPDGSLREIRAWLERNAADENPTVITRLNFQDELALRGPDKMQHLFIVDPEQPRARGTRISSGFFDHQDAAFVSDGRRIVYAAKKSADQHPDRVLGTDLWQMNADGTDDRVLLQVEGWSLSQPRPSRDGSVIAFLGQQIDEPAFRQSCLGMVSAGGGEQVWLTSEATFDGSVNRAEWLTSQSAIYFTTARKGGFPLMTISPRLLEPAVVSEAVDGRPIGVHAFGVGGGAIVWAATSAANPCEVMVRDARGEQVMWNPNEWAQQRNISLPEEMWVTRPDGIRVQAWLMPPTAPEKGRKYPLVLNMHGGPSAMWGPGESTMWHEFQLMCSWGYGVVYCNPRGSGGYGYAFQKGNFQNWGDGPAGDVLAVVDDVIAKHDWIDREKMVITGGSYAGYLTAWIIAHDHRFKAAAAQRGVYDLDTFFGEGNAWRLVEWAFGGWPWDPRIKPILARESPFTHVARIKTPLLILHASQDLRTGVSQSEMLYRALKMQGRSVEYVRYPGAGHDLSRTGEPRQRMDRLNRILEFFQRHVENPRGAPKIGLSQSSRESNR